MKNNHEQLAEAGSEFRNLSPEQIETIKRYDRDNHLNGNAEATCENKLIDVCLFGRWSKKPFIDATEEDTKTYFDEISKRLGPGSITLKMNNIRIFYRWLYKTDDYPPLVKWMKPKSNYNKRLPSSILTPKEVKILIDKAETPQHKAILAVLYDTGCRLGELAGMNLNEIVYDEHGAFTVVKGKTGTRRVRFIHSLRYISSWLEFHPEKDNVKKNTYRPIPLQISHSIWKILWVIHDV